MKNISEIILNLDQLFRRCRLKIFQVLALVAILFSGAEPFLRNNMKIKGRGHYGEHSCKIILNLNHWFLPSPLLKSYIRLNMIIAMVSEYYFRL